MQALESIPGGVNSPVRAFRGVWGNPLFIESGPFVSTAHSEEDIDSTIEASCEVMKTLK